MPSATISVIIPTYNREQWLSQALDSVFAQTHPAEEIILVDDGSTDGTEALIKTRYPTVIYLKQNNQGVSAARNRGIKQSTGDWIAFLDSDDLWYPTKLAKQSEHVKQHAQAQICHTEEVWVRNGKHVKLPAKFNKQSGWLFEKSLRHCAISPSTVFIHKSVLSEVGLFDETLSVCEDYDLWLRIMARYPIELIDEPLIQKNGGHDDQLSTSTWGLDRFRALALHRFLQTFPKLSNGQRQVAEKALVQMCAIIIQGAQKHKNKKVEQTFKAIATAYSA